MSDGCEEARQLERRLRWQHRDIFINRIAVVLRDEIMRQAPDLALTSIEIDCTVLAERVAEALQLTEEKHTYADCETKAVMGGEGNMRYGGQTSRYLGQKTVRRWVSEWTAVKGQP